MLVLLTRNIGGQGVGIGRCGGVGGGGRGGRNVNAEDGTGGVERRYSKESSGNSDQYRGVVGGRK